MELMNKLTILTDGAKYDAACTSSGSDRPGSTVAAGICHSFTSDGRCISLLKVLMSNNCIYNCKYCVNSASSDVPRATFTPDELAELTTQFYRRNYIEGLFLSSGVVKNPDHTMELMINALAILRHRHNFWGYIHAKTIPGASSELVHSLGLLVDRLSVNIELPSEKSLTLLAPNKTKDSILAPMQQIKNELAENTHALSKYKNAPTFASAGQATQMIIGATEDTDHRIITLASALYKKYSLKRVFYSAYIPVMENSLLPAVASPPPLLREHRLYQADFLMRQYEFASDEILSEDAPNLNPYLDPKCNWAINNMHFFPIDVNTASMRDLLRVPGIGPTSARRIVVARREGRLGFDELKRIGVVLKRAKYFILTKDSTAGLRLGKDLTARALIDPKIFAFGAEQLSLFDGSPIPKLNKALPHIVETHSISDAVEEAVLCLASNL
ncbi:MAG: putative DNA modification/repair radical SAM protein [Oscillospiraceae bacterium]|nr:putative DNA modification/repair radical SAM protein [Oscillospiraceae bacterium]MCL2227834.1 putative DNA modification/repair radical SAM protein [Oscillospiraceae bacterium]